MAAHDSIDARHGISTELLTDLREADVVVIGLKDHHTAIARIEIGPRVRIVVLAAHMQLVHGRSLAREQPLVIGDAQHDLLWRKVVDALHTGEVATVEWMLGWSAVSVNITIGPKHAGHKWTLADFQRLTLPMPRLDVWPSMEPPAASPVRSLPLGFTTQRRRWVVGQPTWIWARPPDR
jgi:hypothetical protein